MSETPNSERSTLANAVDRIRETAKWLVVCLAGIGGVLAAGVQLSGVGSLEPHSHRFNVALCAGIFAVIGATLILGAAVWTATAKTRPLSSLNPEMKPLEDPVLLQGHTNLDELRTEYLKALEQRRAALEAHYAVASTENYDSVDADRKKDLADAAQKRAKFLDGIVRNVLEVNSYHRLLSRWRISSCIIAIGALLAGAGVVMFAWAANPPESAKASSMTPGMIGSAAELKVELTKSGQEALRTQLGATCPISEPLSIYALDDTASGADIIVVEDGCDPIRLILETEWGTVHTP